MVRAVLFDLDDTLFDHQGGARLALEAVHRSHAGFASTAFTDLSRAHGQFLEQLHVEVMAGRLTIDQARLERFRRLFGAAGVSASSHEVEATVIIYRDSYIAARRAVAGALTLLPLVRARARVGIVSNNLQHEQMEKMRTCGLDAHVDRLVVSETVGVAKPDPAIFREALRQLDCRADEAVMVGDAWHADIDGARAAGIRPVWFNPAGLAAPDATVAQLRSLEPAAEALAILFGSAGASA